MHSNYLCHSTHNTYCKANITHIQNFALLCSWSWVKTAVNRQAHINQSSIAQPGRHLAVNHFTSHNVLARHRHYLQSAAQVSSTMTWILSNQWWANLLTFQASALTLQAQTIYPPLITKLIDSNLNYSLTAALFLLSFKVNPLVYLIALISAPWIFSSFSDE